MIFLDIDRFKEFNTKYTESVVDESVLPAFMSHLREFCAGRGEAYRQGGDEFVVILPNCDLGEAQQFAERIRKQIAAVQFNVSGRTEILTVSIGVASRGPTADDYKTVLKKANEGKAEAKKARNIVVAIE